MTFELYIDGQSYKAIDTNSDNISLTIEALKAIKLACDNMIDNYEYVRSQKEEQARIDSEKEPELEYPQ